MPAEAAAEAAAAAVAPDAPEQSTPQARKSLFGGLSRALGRRSLRTGLRPNLLNLFSPAIPRRSLLKRTARSEGRQSAARAWFGSARSQRHHAACSRRANQSKPGHSDAARQDFLAAARRHAQAAAAEAAISSKSADDAAGTRRSGFGSFLKRYRKPALMAATGLLVVFAGAKLGQDYLDGENEVATTAPTPLAAGPQADDAGLAADPVVTSGTTRGLPTAALTETTADDELLVGATPDMDGNSSIASATAADEQKGAESDPHSQLRMSAQPVTQTASFSPVTPNLPGDAAPTTDTSAAPQEVRPAALRDAAAAGDAIAMFEVGARYAEGRG